MPVDEAVFSNVAKRNYLDLWGKGLTPRFKRVAELLDFRRDDIARAAGVPKSRVHLDEKRIPEEVLIRFREWAAVLSLVAEFFEGDANKTILWFQLENPQLGGVAPRNMIRAGRFERLYNFITQALAENPPRSAN